jgi:hypothetical protein
MMLAGEHAVQCVVQRLLLHRVNSRRRRHGTGGEVKLAADD